jgi:hypothetical protein
MLGPTHRVAENQGLIEAVFADLEARQPKGFTYKVFRLEDGVSFIHMVTEHDGDEHDSLQEVPAFRAFVAGVADRCDVPPVAAEQASSVPMAELAPTLRQRPTIWGDRWLKRSV